MSTTQTSPLGTTHESVAPSTPARGSFAASASSPRGDIVQSGPRTGSNTGAGASTPASLVGRLRGWLPRWPSRASSSLAAAATVEHTSSPSSPQTVTDSRSSPKRVPPVELSSPAPPLPPRVGTPTNVESSSSSGSPSSLPSAAPSESPVQLSVSVPLGTPLSSIDLTLLTRLTNESDNQLSFDEIKLARIQLNSLLQQIQQLQTEVTQLSSQERRARDEIQIKDSEIVRLGKEIDCLKEPLRKQSIDERKIRGISSHDNDAEQSLRTRASSATCIARFLENDWRCPTDLSISTDMPVTFRYTKPRTQVNTEEVLRLLKILFRAQVENLPVVNPHSNHPSRSHSGAVTPNPPQRILSPAFYTQSDQQLPDQLLPPQRSVYYDTGSVAGDARSVSGESRGIGEGTLQLQRVTSPSGNRDDDSTGRGFSDSTNGSVETGMRKHEIESLKQNLVSNWPQGSSSTFSVRHPQQDVFRIKSLSTGTTTQSRLLRGPNNHSSVAPAFTPETITTPPNSSASLIPLMPNLQSILPSSILSSNSVPDPNVRQQPHSPAHGMPADSKYISALAQPVLSTTPSSSSLVSEVPLVSGIPLHSLSVAIVNSTSLSSPTTSPSSQRHAIASTASHTSRDDVVSLTQLKTQVPPRQQIPVTSLFGSPPHTRRSRSSRQSRRPSTDGSNNALLQVTLPGFFPSPPPPSERS